MDIRKTRKKFGWTQAQLAEKLGVNHSIVSRMESGEIPVNLRTLLAMETIVRKHSEGLAK